MFNFTERNYPGGYTPQHPTLFGVEFTGPLGANATFWLKSTTIPGQNVGIGSIEWMNGRYNYVTRTVPAGEWSCSFYLFEDMAAHKFLWNWYLNCIDINSGKIGDMSFYKQAARVWFWDSQGSQRTLEFTMYNVILAQISPIQNLNFEQDQPIIVDAAFTYETFNIEYGRETGDISVGVTVNAKFGG